MSTIHLGDEFDLDVREKINWLRANFHSDEYTIRDEGFLINDYYLSFVDESNKTLYYLKWL